MNTGKEIKTAEEILIANVPKDCIWQDMRHLTNTPFHYVISAMEQFKNQGTGIKWVKASKNPKESVECVCIVENIKDRSNGKISIKPAYGLWNGDYWRTDEGWKVIEYLDEGNVDAGSEDEFKKSKNFEGDAVEKEQLTDELVKEMIYSKLPVPDHYIANVQKCLDEFKESKNFKSEKEPSKIEKAIEWASDYEGEEINKGDLLVFLQSLLSLSNINK